MASHLESGQGHFLPISFVRKLEFCHCVAVSRKLSGASKNYSM
jgi:hypothetical protein